LGNIGYKTSFVFYLVDTAIGKRRIRLPMKGLINKSCPRDHGTDAWCLSFLKKYITTFLSMPKWYPHMNINNNVEDKEIYRGTLAHADHE
jgi:hypothetical protein